MTIHLIFIFLIFSLKFHFEFWRRSWRQILQLLTCHSMRFSYLTNKKTVHKSTNQVRRNKFLFWFLISKSNQPKKLKIKTMIDIENHKIKNELNTNRIRGTELNFLLLVRSADPADSRCDWRTDGHNGGALCLLVLNTLKLSSGYS